MISGRRCGSETGVIHDLSLEVDKTNGDWHDLRLEVDRI
jgi:hypothetical protein